MNSMLEDLDYFNLVLEILVAFLTFYDHFGSTDPVQTSVAKPPRDALHIFFAETLYELPTSPSRICPIIFKVSRSQTGANHEITSI